MRKLISLICIFSAVSFSFYKKADGSHSCETFLAKINTDYPEKLSNTLSKARAILDKSKNLKFISNSKYIHLLEDLEELSKNLNKKSENQSFTEIINKWNDFSLILKKQIQSFERLPEIEQKLYFEKMKLPISFMTSHFITFLETKHLKFSYQRMYSILKFTSELEENSDLILFLFEFEKQVLKFFSKNEFIDCLA